MTWPPVDLCCSESSEDMSSPSGVFGTSTLSSTSQQTVGSCADSGVTAGPQLFTNDILVREELECLLLREDHGPQPFNYIPFHTFMSHKHREFLVQSINSVSFSTWATLYSICHATHSALHGGFVIASCSRMCPHALLTAH